MNAVLKEAYELERRGLEFYIDSAVKLKNALAKRTLFSLAQEEIKHMMKIEEIATSMGAGGKWVETDISLKPSDIEIEIKGFFENTRKEILARDRDKSELIGRAMEFERKSFELYEDLAKKAKTPDEKSFFEELKKEEEKHFDVLQNVHYYLTASGDWFGKDESGVWNWMNL